MNRIFPLVIRNENIAEKIYEMKLKGNFSDVTVPGQFINILIDGCYLRRPISVCDKDGEILTIIYKTVGKGTEKLSEMKEGESLDVLSGLGNGFDLSKSGGKPLVVGGGVGVSPLYFLTKKLVEKGVEPTVVIGFNTKNEIFYYDEFLRLGASVFVVTADGSAGEKGFVTDVSQRLDYTYFYSCGPMPMYKAFEKQAKTSGEYSFEERMGCGFGACMGCAILTKSGMKRICKDGPILKREEIIW